MDGLIKSPRRSKRTILHIDGDAFFVGVEIAKNPKLKGLPVVTGEERGIVSALSYEAKALGVVRGMPIFTLNKKFPEVIILPGDYKSYVEFSEKMFDIVRRYVDDVEEYSIDECFADLTGLDSTLKMTYLQIAERIKKEVNKELGLSVSIGIAPTKVLAKIASNWVKPNGLTVIDFNTAPDFMSKVKVGKVWGIGPKTAEVMNRKGIQTAQDFAKKDLEWVMKNFSRPYDVIWQELNGAMLMEIDPNPKGTYASIQKTHSFHPPTNDKTFLLSELSKHIEDACRKARHYKLTPKKFSIFLKTKDFKYITSLILLSTPTNAPETLINLANEQFQKMHEEGVLYRTTGVTLQDLNGNGSKQSDLFGNTEKANKYEVIHGAIDALEDKFGKRMVYLASTQGALKKKTKGTESDDLDRDLLFL